MTSIAALRPVLRLALPQAILLGLLLAACGGGSVSPGDPVCAVSEAEHPNYTPSSRRAGLCGNGYTTANAATACSATAHVCGEAEWHEIYPEGAAPGGKHSTWGAIQHQRCIDGAWVAGAPGSQTYTSDFLCNGSDPDYNPYSDGKLLVSDDGTTLMAGDGGWGSWDSTFSATEVSAESDYAVYCCKN